MSELLCVHNALWVRTRVGSSGEAAESVIWAARLESSSNTAPSFAAGTVTTTLYLGEESTLPVIMSSLLAQLASTHKQTHYIGSSSNGLAAS